MPRRDVANASLCAAAFIIITLLLNPRVNTPFDDDFSYAFTVKRLLETGHLIYNGWSAPILITHAWWGAAWAQMFGFSFNTLRLSTLPLAAGSLSLCYLIARHTGLRPWESFFITALVGLSPLFLPLALSFMTDVPALFFMLASLYCLMLTRPGKERLPWLLSAVAIAIVGGMGRQTVWIVPLSILPYLAIRWRHNRTFVAAAATGWLAVLIAAVATLHWFASKRDVMTDESILHNLANVFAAPLQVFIPYVLKSLFTMALFVLPATVAFVILQIGEIRRRRRGIIVVAIVLAGLTLYFFAIPTLLTFPWLFNIVAPDGPVGNLELSGHNPEALPPGVIYAISLAAVAVVALLLIAAIERTRNFLALLASLHRFFFLESGETALPIFVVFISAYYALLLTRVTAVLVFDRYFLPVMPLVAVAAMLQLRQMPIGFARRTVAIVSSTTLLFIFSAYGVATMESLIALQRARNQAIDVLLAKGVPPTEIAAGLEYDMWTQLNSGGWFNRFGVHNPSHPFLFNEGITFSLYPRYRIEHDITRLTEHTDLPAIRYTAWLPPFHRTIYIDRFKDEIWSGWMPGMRPPLRNWEDIPIY